MRACTYACALLQLMASPSICSNKLVGQQTAKTGQWRCDTATLPNSNGLYDLGGAVTELVGRGNNGQRMTPSVLPLASCNGLEQYRGRTHTIWARTSSARCTQWSAPTSTYTYVRTNVAHWTRAQAQHLCTSVNQPIDLRQEGGEKIDMRRHGQLHSHSSSEIPLLQPDNKTHSSSSRNSNSSWWWIGRWVRRVLYRCWCVRLYIRIMLAA